MQVKDLLAHLYFKAKETFAQQQPPEVRILKYLLTIDSPANRYKLMEMAFEQGECGTRTCKRCVGGPVVFSPLVLAGAGDPAFLSCR